MTLTVCHRAVLPNWIQILKTFFPTPMYPDLSSVIGFSCPGKVFVCFGQMESKETNKTWALASPRVRPGHPMDARPIVITASLHSLPTENRGRHTSAHF